MKRIICLPLFAILLLSLVACAKQETNSPHIDLDLTQYEGNALYYAACDLTMSPTEFIGKVVKVTGQFLVYSALDDQGKVILDKNFYSCRVIDPTGCLSQELEFVLAGDHTFPDDYPELGKSFTVTGKFDTYEEDGHTYCQLVDAVIEF